MLTLTKQFFFETNNNISLKYFLINNKVFIVYTLFNRLFYFVVPAFLNINKKDLIFHIWANLKNKSDLNQYYSFFNAFFIFNDINKKYKKKLFLKGLGFKIFYDKTSHSLNFKLGFSHSVLFSLPSNVFVSLNKTTLLLESKNNVVLGDITNKIKLLKIPDVYKGKGFVIKNEFIRSKPIKKK
jgi:large subunit ribosomal protein L6